MATPSPTLLLDTVTWDLVLDASGNIAMARAPYAAAQDAASSIKLFQGELWFDTSQGVPYFSQVLGKLPPLNYMKALFETAALTVPAISSATVFLTSITNRTIRGQVQTSTSSGQIAAVNF